MSILIKGIDMPEEGHLIVRIYASGEVCEPTECVGVWGKVATAVPVPPHGRLIDADECHKYFYDHLDDLHMEIAEIAIEEMPTIIEAEDGT